MYPTFEQRRDAIQRKPKGSPRILSGDDHLKLAKPANATSEQRLEALLAGSWSPQLFLNALRDFLPSERFSVSLVGSGGTLPELHPDGSFKYLPSYPEARSRIEAGEEVRVSVVQEEGWVIGFGIADKDDGTWQIGQISVDRSSSRSAGLQRTLSVAGEEFTVGVGHVIVETLIAAVPRPIIVDATNSPSRYIFKSLGFTTRPGAANGCLLQLT